MTADQESRFGPHGRGAGKRRVLMVVGRRALSWSIGILALAVAVFVAATWLAPRLVETLQPGSVQSDGGQAFVQGLSLAAPWPYVVPSHPDYRLSSGDATLIQDGVAIGALEPSHAEIRRLGGGLYDLWQGTLWFSTTGQDPRDPAHTYRFSVATRLAPDFAAARFWCALALLALIAVQIALSAAPYLAISLGRPVQVVRGWGQRGSPSHRAAATVGIALVLGARYLWRLRWRFRLPFLAGTVGLLGGLTILGFGQRLPIMYQADSYGYIGPGLRLADGLSLAGTSFRDLGYPILTFAAVRLGSFQDIVPLQIILVAGAIACMLVVLAAFFAALLGAGGFPAGRVPVLLTAGLMAVGLLYVLMLFSHDGFVINIDSLMAEAPHFLPMAAALMCLAAGWASAARGRRIVLLALATDAAFISIITKPSSLLAFALCAASLVVACALHWRHMRSGAVVATLVCTVVLVGSLRQTDAWVTPGDDDFGAKVLFCNHLDVVDRHIEPTTPERAKIKTLITRVFSLGPHGWPEQGYDGDQCTFAQDFTDAIVAAARGEGLSPKDWQMHEFVVSVLVHPLRYMRHVGRQFLHFMRNPIDELDQRPQSSVADGDWMRLQTFGSMKQVPRERFIGTVPNWFGDLAPELVHDLKAVLRLMASRFALVVAASTLLALWEAFRVRREAGLRAEAILLAVGGFTTALPLTVALSHSFDVGRYSVDILPFTVLWWCMGLVYLLRGAGRAAARLLQARRLRPVRGEDST